MPETAAVVFDVYETLVYNNAALWVQTFDELCRDQGLPISGQELFDRWSPLEHQVRYTRVNLKQPECDSPFQTYEQTWCSCFQQVFHELGQGDAVEAARRSVQALGHRQAYPDATPTMARLREMPGLKLGVLSNADNGSLRPLLERHRWTFDAVLSSESAQAYKPHPEAFRRILDMLGVAAHEALYVGDSQFDDVQGSRCAGMHAVWLNRHGRVLDPALPAPHEEITSLAHLPDVLDASGSTHLARKRGE